MFIKGGARKPVHAFRQGMNRAANDREQKNLKERRIFLTFIEKAIIYKS